MKAIGRRARTSVLLALLGTITASCSERVIPPPAPAPRPSAPPPAPAPPPREAADWRDAPITPGDWTATREGGAAVARFAGGALELRCDPAAGVIRLRRAGAPSAAAAMTIMTSSITRTVNGAGGPAGVTAAIPARDPLLDAMAFSRGRFAVDVAGMPALYAPSWPEVSRVVEECR